MAAEDESIRRKVNRTGKLVFDVECTGKTASDQLIAVGYAWTRKNGSVVSGFHALSMTTPDEDVQLNEGDLTWLDIWRRRGFEMRCFTEFWNAKGKRSLLELLGSLQYGPTVVVTEAELAMRVNRVIADAEAHWGNVQIITNTTAFDTCWLHNLLVDHHYLPLDTTRAGAHRWTYESDSFLLGSLGETPDTVNWKKFDKFRTVLDALKTDHTKHDHHPANDAKAILAEFEATEIFNAMVSTTLLDVLTAPDEEYGERLRDHLRDIRKRANFLRRKMRQE